MTEPQRDILIHVVPSARWGGVEQYALDICRHYHTLGWDVSAVTRDAKAVDSHFMAYGIPLRHALFGGYSDMGSIWQMARTFRTMPRDRVVVHVHRYRDAFTVLAARKIVNRPDIRLVSTRHTVAPGRDTPLFRRMCRNVDADIFVSRTALEAFASPWTRKRSPLPEERVHVIYNGLFLDDKPLMAEPQRGPVTAICQGPIVEGKGFETVIDALAMLKQRNVKLRLRIAGYGNPDYIDDLRRRAITRGIMEQIDWIIPAGDIYLLIGESHFGVQASARREAFGLESLRCMACGRAQVCVPNGAQSEYLAEGVTAVFAPPNDSSKLADAMMLLAQNHELRDSLGTNARAYYERNLNWEHFISRMDKIYNP